MRGFLSPLFFSIHAAKVENQKNIQYTVMMLSTLPTNSHFSHHHVDCLPGRKNQNILMYFLIFTFFSFPLLKLGELRVWKKKLMKSFIIVGMFSCDLIFSIESHFSWWLTKEIQWTWCLRKPLKWEISHHIHCVVPQLKGLQDSVDFSNPSTIFSMARWSLFSNTIYDMWSILKWNLNDFLMFYPNSSETSLSPLFVALCHSFVIWFLFDPSHIGMEFNPTRFSGHRDWAEFSEFTICTKPNASHWNSDNKRH